MKKPAILAILSLITLSATISYAEEYPYIYKGIRPMGMGGAFVAVSNDANALFYNPAGLSYITEKKLTLISVEAEESQGGYEAFKDALDIDTENSQETADFLRDYIGDYKHAAASSFIRYERPSFAFGIFGTAKYNFMARDYANPKLIVDDVQDIGGGIGYAHPFLENKLSLGASAKYVSRKSLNREYSLIDLAGSSFDEVLKDDRRKNTDDGSGALLDLGVIYRFDEVKAGDKNIVFQVGMAVNNLIGADLGDAEDLKEHVDIGFSADLGSWRAAIDYVDLLKSYDEDDDTGKRLRLGIEYTVRDYLTLRAGFYQGYPTFGASLGNKYAQLDLLTYAEEVGTYSGQNKDRRYQFGLSFGF